MLSYSEAAIRFFLPPLPLSSFPRFLLLPKSLIGSRLTPPSERRRRIHLKFPGVHLHGPLRTPLSKTQSAIYADVMVLKTIIRPYVPAAAAAAAAAAPSPSAVPFFYAV